MKCISLFGAALLLIASAGFDEASAQRGRGFGGAGFRGGAMGFRGGVGVGRFGGVGVGVGRFGGVGVGRVGWVGRPGWGVGRPGWGWAGRPGWGWRYPVAAGIAAAGYYGYYGSYPYSDCLAWNGYRWVDVCYSGYSPYGYW
jgi:hypothetical protein